MYWLIYMLLAHGASARTAGYSARPNGLGPAAPGGAGNGGGSEGGVLLLLDPFFSPLSSLLPRPQRRIAYYESSTDAPAVYLQSSPAPEGFEGDEAGENAGDDGSLRPSPGVGANPDARLPPGGTSSPLPAVATIRGGGGDYPEDAGGGGGGGALGGQAPFPSLPGLGAGDSGSSELSPGDALPTGNSTGPSAVEGRGSLADVLVS